MKHEPQNAAILNAPAPGSGGRWAAGEDPVKRHQILEGAKRVFMKMGFDAASMNDVTREAGVSKGTLYVYFANKEDLFAAMMESERTYFVNLVRTALSDEADVTTSLYDFGMVFVTHVTSNKTINAMRTVIGVRERMPSLCQRFFTGPENLRTVLRGFLERQVAAGHLKIDDFDMAAISSCGCSAIWTSLPRRKRSIMSFAVPCASSWPVTAPIARISTRDLPLSPVSA